MDPLYVVDLAMTLPGTTRRDHTRSTSVRVRGKGFVWVNHEDETVTVKSSHDERSILVASAPLTYSPGWESRSSAWIVIDLAHAPEDLELLELLAEGWRMNAAAQAVNAFDATHPDGLSALLPGQQ